MKRILIVANDLAIGGIQRSLTELLRSLSGRVDLSVSLLLCDARGELVGSLPSDITLLPTPRWAEVSVKPLSECRAIGARYGAFRAAASGFARLFGKGLPTRALCRLIGDLGEYDVAISYSQPIGDRAFCALTNEIVLYCCRADRKVTFVHCDFGRYGGNCRANRRLYRRFDKVAAVSDSVGRAFADCLPELRERVVTVRNICNSDEVRALADDSSVIYRGTGKAIVTVARLSAEKGLLRCLPIFADLRDRGAEFEWHIVGGGPLEDELRTRIAELGLSDRVILEGEQTNPYRFMKNADLFLLPSYHEAAPMVFAEAQALRLPILTTETLSARELVADTDAGKVCENSDGGIAAALEEILLK